MLWLNLIVFLNVMLLVLAMNRPVYKISLTQKGYAQFLQYDIDTPPIREFTFCTWFRIYDLSGDQTILTYLVNGNHRLLRLWLDTEGQNIKFSINGRATSTSPVDISKSVWTNICLSYQSDYGAWAIYVDSHLISCQTSMYVSGFVLPGNGSLIVGYGTNAEGDQNGLEGEIFGANMILSSTIERNISIINNPHYEQKPFHRNKIRGHVPNEKYIILDDLQTDEVNDNYETTTNVQLTNSTRSYISIETPYSFVSHDVGWDLDRKNFKQNSPGDNNFSVPNKNRYDTPADSWKLHNDMEFSENIAPSISEYEVPPPPPKFITKPLDKEKLTTSEPTFNTKKETDSNRFEIEHTERISEVETPPPLDTNKKVYGQWTSSKFAGNVLNYLKNIQLRNKEKWRSLVPPTIPLSKLSDNFPYASNLIGVKLRPPPEFQRKSIVEKQVFESRRVPTINVKILENDLRSNILKSHALTFAKNVEITNRGMRKHHEGRFYRNANYVEEEEENEEEMSATNSFEQNNIILRKTKTTKQPPNKNFISKLPFLKSVEYDVNDLQIKETKENNDVYTESLSNPDKWHNVKAYSNDYNPREIKMKLENPQQNLDDDDMQMYKKRYYPLKIKYKQSDHKVVQYNDDQSILKGRQLAKEISDQSQVHIHSPSIFKYNHGYLPSNDIKFIDRDALPNTYKNQNRYTKNSKNNFNKHVKIGNALNEQPIIGDSVEENKKSFIGGDERVPDIHKYRAVEEKNQVYDKIPGSLSPKVCKNLEYFDRFLYVQPDGSINTRHIISRVSVKNNIGIDFVIQNYKKCSLRETNLQSKTKLFIEWSKTPVRLYGGAYPMKTTDLCGFF